ncbi:MAG: hypothetical protein ACJA0G_000004 [Kangiellaceae bacterium]|jgi:hypothetical protein
MKLLRMMLGGILISMGILLTVLPGSILFLLAGLILVSIDYKPARKLLALIQKSLTKAAVQLDRFLLKRKYR